MKSLTASGRSSGNNIAASIRKYQIGLYFPDMYWFTAFLFLSGCIQSAIKVEDYDAVFIPGGAWNPDNLRYDKDVIRFLQQFYQSGKLVAAICHAPVVLASANILKGKKLTGYWNIHTDLINAGGQVTDEPVVIDGNLITSRHPIDVADFSLAVADWLTKHK